MKRYLLLILMTMIFACTNNTSSKQDEGIKIKGNLLSVDGSKFEDSNLRLLFFGEEILDTSITTGSEGNFELNVNGPGLARLVFTAPYYKPNFIEIIIDENTEDLKFDVQMSPYVPDENSKQYVVIGSFNNFNFESGIMLTEESEGVYSGDVPNDSDTLKYQVLGVVNFPVPRSINGTQQDFFEADETGDYRSVIVSDKNSVKIKLDLNEYSTEEKGFNLLSENSDLRNYFLGLQDQEQVFSQMDRSIRQIFPANSPEQEQMIKDYIKNALDSYSNKIKSSSGSVKSSYGLKYLETVSYTQMIGGFDLAEKEIIKDIYSSIPSSSPLWMKATYAVLPTLGLIEDNPIESQVFKNILKDTKLDNVNLELLYFAVEYAYENKLTDFATEYYKTLVSEYPNSQQAAIAQKKYNPNRKVLPGKSIPDFELTSVDSQETYTPETFKGKYVLYDVWATWCGPCVREMPNLHKAYEQFKDKNFTIFSLSIDKRISDIDKFRKGKWKMPWQHTFMPGVWESKLTEIFEVTSVPRPILVGPDGKIISTSPQELRGEQLIRTIGRYVE